jgi:tRNA G10  N-methylase Trm11
MIRQLYENICAGEARRANLISLKKELKSEKNRAVLKKLTGNRLDEIMKCLVDEDAKVRKNAAAILGLMHCQDALDVLMDAYTEEEQLFVKSEYVSAMAQLDCTEYLPDFHARLEALIAYDAPESEQKHIQAEIKALQELILQKEGIKKHIFTGWNRSNEVIFVTQPTFRDVLAAEIPDKKTLLKSGVRTVVSDLQEAMKIRTFAEILFVITCSETLSDNPMQLANALQTSNLMELLYENHREETPFYFRIGVSGKMQPEERSVFAKKAASAIEQAFSRKLINSASHYEIELRLIQGKDGNFVPFLKLYTLEDHRFDYRRYHVAASMRPQIAAGLMALAKPYMKEHAQILDPFCGVGTMLIERKFLVPARNAYGIDTFGEAIEKARINSKIVGMQTNYINRDFFDFIHDYSFDEIVTDMPTGNFTKHELDELYGRFFEKSAEVLSDRGRIICYSREMGLIKKQLRIHNDFRLLKEFCIQEKSGAYLFILEKK